MPLPNSQPKEICFGSFRLNPSTGELCNNGRKITLQEKPLQLLMALLERPGELFTREELRSRLWGSDTFVDFDLSLNKAMNRLRESLRDSAEKPRFIETLPRRGYRFIGPVDGNTGLVAAGTTSPEVAGRVAELVSSGSEPATKSTSTPLDPPPQRSRKRLFLAGSFAVLLVGYLAANWWGPGLAPPVLVRMTQITNDGRIKHGPLLANGGVLYYNRRVDETWEIAQTSARSGTSLEVPSSRGFFLMDMASDGSELLVSTGSIENTFLYSLALPTGAPRRIADIRATDASWSPDRTKLAYSLGSDLFLGNHDGGGAHKLASAPGPISPIRWSPDGQKISFTVSDMKADRLSMWQVKQDGTRLRPMLQSLTPKPGEWGTCCGQWTPDGEYFVFQSDHDGGENLWITSESGGIFPTRKPSRLTFGPQRIVASVSDRDGKTLYAIGLIQRGELLRYDDRAKRFASYLPGLSAVQLSFSRDGRLLAYVSFPDRSLWRCHSDGSECAQLTSPPMVASWPQWSPDGKQIVFSAQVRGEPFHVYVSPVQGGELQQLTHGERDELNPTWSASGKEIVFGTGLDLQGDSLGIYRLNLLTKEQSTFPGSHHKLFFPQYSPDGKHLAALDQGKLALFSYATQQWTKYEKIEASQPNWSANGDCIYFVGKDQQRSDVYRLRVADQKVERVASLASVRRQSYGGFAWNGTAPDGSLIVFQDASNSEIYSFTWQ